MVDQLLKPKAESFRGNSRGGWWWAVLWLALVWGCNSAPQGTVSVDGRRSHPPLLLSEVQAHPDPQSLLDTEFQFQNSQDVPASLRYDGAGCSCYQVTSGERQLVKGDVLTIPPRGRLAVQIGVPTPTSASAPEYVAQFNWLRDGHDPVNLPVSLTLPVYSDLSLLPSVVTAGYRPDETPAPIPLRLTRTSRHAEELKSPPVASELSELLRLSDWREISREQPAENLYRVTWQSELELQLPKGYRQQVSTAFTLQSGASPSTRLSVLIQPLVGVRGPGELQFGLLKAGEPRRRRLLLTAADKRPFRVTAIECVDERCRGRVLSPEAAERHWLEVEAELPSGSELATHLVCMTDHPESPEIIIPVLAESSVETPASASETADDPG